MSLYIGCSGWSYSGWRGNFYPQNIENKDYLTYYSKFFNFVEVDSTYYHIPSRSAVRNWKDKTPSDFKFTLKFPKIITHERKLEDVSKPLSLFFYALEPLIDKTLMLLIQLPPYLTEKKGFGSLRDMALKLDKRFRYALEVRDSSWFNEDTYEFLKEKDMALVWSVRDELKTVPIVTSDQLYVRFIGDRSIQDKDFGKIVKDRRTEMNEYVKRIREINNDVSIQDLVIAFNNHYAGFGPQSVNDFLKMLDEPEVNWKDELKRHTHQQNNNSNIFNTHFQTSLSDFSNS